MIVAILVVVALSLPIAWVVARRPVQRRLAFRYPFRRPVESLLVILGTLLGTAIITGSLTVGDTIGRSIRASAYEQLGPIDELVSVPGVDAGRAVATRFEGFEHPTVDGVLSFVTLPVAVAGDATQPRAQLIEVDFDAGRDFGGDASITGLGGTAPPPGSAVVTTDLAARAAIEPGDTITAYAYGRAFELSVDRVVARRGVAGFWPIDSRQQSYNLIVPVGTLESLAIVPAAATAGGDAAEPPTFHIAFSNAGGVEAGADGTDDAVAAIAPLLDGTGFQPRAVKRDVITAATEAATSLTQLYFTMGMFAVAAGVLLVVNIFVMLADDRRSELGMLRAIGLRRRPLVGAFSTEGWLYSIASSAIGAIAGIGFGWVIAWRADRILTSGSDLTSIDLTYTYSASTIAIGFAVGFAISLATIALTSVRTSRMNVIAAIRDLPTVAVRTLRRRWWWIGLAVAGLGAIWTVAAVIGRSGPGVAIGPLLVLVGIGPALSNRIGFRPATAIVAVATLVWGAGFVAALAVLDIDVDIPMFLIQGLSMAGAAVALVTVFQGVIGRWLAQRLHGSVTARLGLAYPIARRSRTAMTLGMFSVIILTLVYLSVLSSMFNRGSDEVAADLSGGFGVVVNSNPTNPLTADRFAEIDGVGDVAPLTYGVGEFTVDDRPARPWPMTGFGPELAAAPPALQKRGPYATDAEAWQAVLADPNLVIVDELFLAAGGGPPTGVPSVGETMTVRDPVSGRSREVTVAAWAVADVLFSGVFYGRDGFDELTDGRSVPTRFFVEPLGDGPELAATIRTTFVANGADAEAVTDSVATFLAQQTGFFALMQQFVGVGLIVGICGIGVIMVRAVRERRRVVGVLRSLGFPPGAIGRAFMIEAGFVAAEGTLIGIAVALIGSYGLVASGASFTENMTWVVPWFDVGLIALVALGASAITAVFPARRASKIEPADALRLTD